MALHHVMLLGCLALALLLLPFPSNAEFLNEDLVFEEPSSPPSWRTEKFRTLLYNKNINSLQNSINSNSESESGLWHRTLSSLRRLKRGLWDSWFDEAPVTTQSIESTTEGREFTQEQDTSNTLSRETRSTNNVDEINKTHRPSSDISSLTSDDDDYNANGGTSGDDFASGDLQPDLLPTSSSIDELELPFSPTPFRVTHRVTITVDEPFTEEIADRNSESFKEFSEHFSIAVDNLLKDIEGDHKTTVINVESADDVFKLTVTLDIVSNGADSYNEIKEKISDQIKHYRRIDPYGVSAEGFSFRKFGAVSEGRAEYSPEACAPGDIQCPTFIGGNCLTNGARCNGSIECRDGSDEAGCPHTEPSTTTTKTKDRCSFGDNEVHCADGSTLICESQKCDGKPDCPGSDDEHGCGSECREFTCDGTRCIPMHEVCDGVAQCEDKTDELQNCPTENRTTSNKTEREEAKSGASFTIDRCRADDKVRCADGSTFICDDQKCDGKPDCPGGDDENNCSHDCSLEEFQCDTDRCIPIKEVCDGIPQCDDKTDESCSKACGPDQFQCHDSSGCVDREHYCDGHPDCRDSSDESHCQSPSRPEFLSCPLGQFLCSMARTCIPLSKRCDGVIDCLSENSDEMGCPCDHSRQFECDDHTCIDIHLRCNGRKDCPQDTSDEQGCPREQTHRECTASEFKCRNGMCIDKSRKCDKKPDCADNSDEQSCKCSANEIKCENDYCIAQEKWCDGIRNCQDGSDERNCNVSCTVTQFRCRQGGCIEQHLRCNGALDCPDGSDEENCERCEGDQFRCNGGRCLPMSVICNGQAECRDGEDERNCPKRGPSCGPYDFQCRDGGCVSHSKKCNNYPDCIDGSDEDDCEGDIAPCSDSDFTCKDESCIPKRKHCDGRHDCPQGEDEMDCSDGNPVHCMSNEFRCNDGSCIQAAYKCDNVTDCLDKSDELNCRREACDANHITCGDGSCVRKDLTCDGTNDCLDGTDERNCPVRCRADEFSCDGGRCVHNSKRCDRVQDCADYSDENGCSCRSDEFKCGDGSCIPSYRRCDQRSDCRDGSDEHSCPDGGNNSRPAPPEVDSSRVNCPPSQFACHSGDQCVPQSAHCDNNYDCRDYSDESNCAGNPEGLNLRTFPADQIIKESREVVFQCRDEGPLRASVRWTRGDGLPLPPGSRDIKGRLEMPNIQLEHTGSYVCEAIGFSPSTSGSRTSVYLKVEPFEYAALPTRPVCGYNEATCSNGDCIAKSQVCDGQSDCTDGSDEMRCKPHGCEPNEFRCDNKKCVQKTWRCDSDDDCGDGSDERNCAESPPGSTCRYNEYQCRRRDQCIPKAFHCDMEVDCQDGSDEFGCSKAEIQKPPPSMMMKQPGETFTITCTAVGTPMPEVVWRLNWGHIPSKCQTTSVNGYGTLTCPDIQERDQGAYSCEALNNRGSTFAVPDTILIVKSAGTVCQEGTFNELATSQNECIPCFCFGISTSCKSADLFIYQLPPPLDTFRIVNVYVPSSGGLEIRKGESQYQTSVQPIGRSGFQIALTDNELRTSYAPVFPYFALPENYHGNQLKSYGGYIKYTITTDGTDNSLSIPDVILIGNGYTLFYKGEPVRAGVENNIAVRFFPVNWYTVHADTRVESRASRQDLMMALQDISQLLIRTQYFRDGLETTITDINVDSAGQRNNGQGKAAFVEQCACPTGYTGLSCESCEREFMHQQKGRWLGTCEPPIDCSRGYYKDPRDNSCKECLCPRPHQFGYGCHLAPDMNITCDCPVGYEGRRCEKCSSPLYVGNPLIGEACVRAPQPEVCDPAGSNVTWPDPVTGKCLCKEFATGKTCNQCLPNTFNLASGNQGGCIRCFCSGIDTTCTSSDFYRTQIVSVFTRDSQEFSLVPANRLEEPITDIQVNPSAKEIYFNQFNPGTYYWVLPSKFLYNQVTSYGGSLKYTLRYMPTPAGSSSPNSAPDVEIVGDNGVHLVYYNQDKQQQPQPNRPFTVVVPLREQYWQRIDGAPADREHFMMALAELQNILIKATYTTNTQEAALLSVSLDSATRERNTGQSRAVEVELCQCPAGYRGPSCEECEAGYTRIEEGSFLGVCEPCHCHGFSSECDPVTGHCMNCRGNTQGDKCERCAEGYSGNPVAGVPCESKGCYCDPSGSVSSRCDSGNQCVCKTNVVGSSCSECRSGTFDLSVLNLDGCIDCYCSGVTKDCQSSNLYREAIPMQIVDQTHQFSLADSTRQIVIQEDFLLNPSRNEIGYDFAKNQRQQRLFWSLPPGFLGNKVLSYGGNLNFTQRYSALPSYPPSFDTDVIIVGPSSLSISWTREDLLSPNQQKPTSIPLKENKWMRLDPSVGMRPVSRAELMKVLSNVQAILIRATHSTHTQESYLSDVSLDTAVSQRTGKGIASEVEVCRCPPGYKGNSCESCSAGYYQDFDNSCKKCPCNQNEEHCSLGPQQQVMCTCKASFGGTYCDRSINEIMMKLYPERVSATVGDLVKFTCSYVSSEQLTIEFDETFYPTSSDWRQPESIQSSDSHVWGADKYLVTRIRPGHKMVSCRVRNADGELLGTLSSMIYPDGDSARPTPAQPTISISITEAVIIIEAGQDVTFRCAGRSLVSSKPVGLEWSKENANLPQGRAYDNRLGVLLIKDVQASDSGTYVCTASDGFTFVTEKALLNVGGTNSPTVRVVRPMVTVTPAELNVREGELVEFRCDATGVPTPSLQWVGSRSSRLPPQSSFASGMFRIPHASLQDEGEYTCTASNIAGDDSETVHLYVRSAPATRPPLPQIRLSISPQDYNGFTSDTVRLECRASNPRNNLQLQWSRQDEELSPNARDSEGIFTIYNSQPSDSGIYTCTAVDRSTGVIEQEVRARITVNSPHRPQPSITIEPPRQTAAQGSLAELRCITNEGQVQWSKAGDTLPTNAKVLGNTLRIENVQVHDRGVYVCQVEGPGGPNRVTSVVEVERREVPSIELFPKEPQTVTEGGSALFQCRVLQGIPEPRLVWSRVDGQPLSRQVEQLPGGVLRLNKVTESEEGQYLCTADNSEGRATTVAVLEVHSMPIIVITPPGQSIKVSPGQHVRLDCRAYGRPQPMVGWSKHQPGRTFYESLSVTSETAQGAVYEIRGATANDEGSYTCKARNTAGTVEERIQLIVSDEQVDKGPTRGDISSTGNGGIYLQERDYTVGVGGPLTIRCIAQGPQQIYLDWVRSDGRSLSPTAQVREGVLFIQQAQYSDTGDYTCQGMDTRGEPLFSATAHISVVEPLQIRLEPKRQVVRPGDNAKITCSATGEQPINITWVSASSQPLPRSVRVSGGIIEFIGIRESDAGRYVCKASNAMGVLESTADVIVNENPQVSELRAADRNPSAMEGASVQLRCDTPNYQQISWSRENQLLPQRASFEGSILRIDNLHPDDAGRYICRTTSYGSIAQDFIDLKVEKNPCMLDEFACRNRQCVPLLQVCDGILHCSDGSDESSCQIRTGRGLNDIELKIEPSKREVHYGDTVELRCLTVTPQKMQLYWSRADGSGLPSNARQIGEVLRITSASLENTGAYKCTAATRSNRFDTEYYLTVHDDRPTHDAASAETVTVEYGQTARAKCDIDLEGEITYTWARHGEVLPASAQVSGPYLTISSATYKDAGLYICSASNGNIQADIPKIILVQGAVPFFAQAPYSFLTLPTLANSYLSFSIEITFKPENANGLILYNGQHNGGTGDFISFGLHDGIPVFKFDVGSGTGTVSGSQPLALGEWHTVQLHRHKKEGTMYVDENQFYTGHSTGRMSGLDLAQPLFLGGVPNFSNIHKQNGFETGFVGCISRLVINNKEHVDIMKEKRDSEGVTSCETCAVNPCDNSGVCQEAPTQLGYMCLCPRGYSGVNCSRDGEPCYQGVCGSGHCVDTEDGIECNCGLGKTGERCETDLSITEPSFARKSYLAYPTPKALSKIKISLRFNAADNSNGLLLYCAENDDGTGDFISLSIRDRHLELKFEAGSGINTLQSISEIVPGQWVTVNAGMDMHQATLSVSGDALPVSKTVKPDILKFTTPLYIGGYDKQRVRPAVGVGVRTGFHGCVNEIQVSGMNLHLIRSVVDSSNVGQCTPRHGDPCAVRPCHNNGYCRPHPDGYSYTCSCAPGYSGQNCETELDMCAKLQPCENEGSCVGNSSSYKCNCPLGYAGTNCQERITINTQAQFKGDGYVELTKDLLPHTNPTEPEQIHIEFSTTHPDGLILWHGQTPDTHGAGQDYLSVAVVDGYLQFSFELGSKPGVITSRTRVDDGKRHSAVIKRSGKDGSIELDGDLPEFGESQGLLTQLNTNGNIYVGGLPNVEFMTGVHNSPRGFNGCIHSLQIQNSGVINFADRSRSLSSVNVLPCESSEHDSEDTTPRRGDA